MIIKRSNARATSKNPWLTQPRRQFPRSARLNSTPSERLPERRPHTSPSPVKVQSGFTSHAASNRSTRLVGARGGDCAASPRCVSDELQLPTTVRAALDVDIKHALQQLRPTHAPLCAPGPRVVAIACVHGYGCARRRRYRHHRAIAGHFPDAQHRASGLHELGRRRWFYELVTRNYEAPIQLFNAYSFWLQAPLHLSLWSFKS